MEDSNCNCKPENHSCNLSDMQIGENDSSRSPKVLRLNRVKHLVRMMNSSVNPSPDPQHQTSIAGSENF